MGDMLGVELFVFLWIFSMGSIWECLLGNPRFEMVFIISDRFFYGFRNLTWTYLTASMYLMNFAFLLISH